MYRPEPSKYKNLSSECADFLEVVSSCMALVKRLKYSADLPAIIEIANNWQVQNLPTNFSLPNFGICMLLHFIFYQFSDN